MSGCHLTSLMCYERICFKARSVTRGMVAWWPLDEGSGTQVADVSGSGLTGSMPAGKLAVWTSDASGTELTFDGKSAEVVVPESATLTPANGFSFLAWVKLSGDGVIF